MAICSCCPSTSIESPDAPSTAAGDACTSTGAGSAASVTALSPDPSAGSSLGDVSARSLTAGDASSGTAAAAFFADRLRGARCADSSACSAGSVVFLADFLAAAFFAGGLVRTFFAAVGGASGSVAVVRSGGSAGAPSPPWKVEVGASSVARSPLEVTVSMAGAPSVPPGGPAARTAARRRRNRRRRIGRTCCIGCEMGIRVGLVIEHPDSSAARITAPCSFAAPAQLGCGSLRRRCEAASAPAVRLPVSAGARRGGASAHFEQRPVTSLHSIEVEHPRHSNHGQYPTRPSRLRASALWRARGGFVDLACVRVEPPLPEPSEEWYFGGSEVGREPA